MALAPVASRAHGLTTLDVSTIGNAGSYQSRAFMPLPGIGV